MEIAGSTCVYAGLVAVFLGLVNLARPLRWMRVRRRRTAAGVVGAGMLLVAVGMTLPPHTHRVTTAATALDAFLPEWQFNEQHSIRVHAAPERVYAALKQVTAEEIRLFRTLTWIRNPRRPWVPARESILAPPERQPILDVALRGGFVSLADTPGRELVVGVVVCCRAARLDGPAAFTRLQQPGFAKAAMNFLLQDEGGSWTRLTTETRVYGTDPSARRRFATYWRVIYPGSALIRRMWLRAIKARAEGGTLAPVQARPKNSRARP